MGSGFFDELLNALRALSRAPLFVLVHVGLLSAGMLVLTLSFTVYEVFFLRSAAVEAPQQIYRISYQVPNVGWRSSVSEDALKLIANNPEVSGTAGFLDLNNLAIVDEKGAVQVRAQAVTPSFFSVLGVRLRIGRGLQPDDSTEADVPVVLSYRFWRLHYGGDPAVVGRVATLGKLPIRIVGVTERAFQGFTLDTAADLRFPNTALHLLYPSRNGGLPWFLESYGHVVRLKSGVEADRASKRILAAYFAGEEEAWRRRPDFDPKVWAHQKGYPTRLEPGAVGESWFRDHNERSLTAFLAAAGLMYLLVVANLGGLWLARSVRREGEIAVRIALGASRLRLFRGMLMEAAILGSVAALVVVALTYRLAPLLAMVLPPVRDFGWGALQPIAADFTPNVTVLGFAISGAYAATVLLALSPGLALVKVEPIRALRRIRATRHWLGQRMFLALQVGLSTAIVAGALLSVATLGSLLEIKLGYRIDNVATVDVKPVLAGYSGKQSYDLAFRTAERVRALPGVRGVAFGGGMLEGMGMVHTIYPTGRTASGSGRFNTSVVPVSPEFFETIGQRVLSGREFATQDALSVNPEPVIVNRLYAERYFGGSDPVGKTLGVVSGNKPAGADMVIVGVVADAQFRTVRHQKPPIVYTLWNRVAADSDMDDSGIAWKLYFSTEGDSPGAVPPSTLFNPIRAIVHQLAPTVPVTETSTLREQRDVSLRTDSLAAGIAAGFAIFAFLIAGMGIFSLLAQIVASRTREIGIRMALGAHPRRVVALVLRQVLWVVAGGFVVGGAAALLALPKTDALFVGVSWRDPRIFLAAGGFVIAMAAIASALPAWRASRLQPHVALREE